VASVFSVAPNRLIFHPSFQHQPQVQPVIVTVRRGSVRIIVADHSGNVFSWGGMDVTVSVSFLGEPRTVVIPVTFKPSNADRVSDQMLLRVVDIAESPARSNDRLVPLDGNLAGVGPGALFITGFGPETPGGELPGEVVTVINRMPETLDLSDCSFGDHTFKRRADGALTDEGERTLLPAPTADPFDGLKLGAGGTLRISTGNGPAGLEPSAADVLMHLHAPIWSNGDTVWIKNEFGQYVDALTCPSSKTLLPTS
jgi:hypothetical protein